MKWLLTIFAAVLAIGSVAWKLCFLSQNVPTATPSLLNQWEDQVYSLENDELVRFIPPPFSPQRSVRFLVPKAQRSPPQLMCRIINGQIAFTASTSKSGTVHSAFVLCVYLSRSPNLELPGDLGKLPADGDWIVRDEASLPRRMQAMESILSGITGRRLAVERPSVERDVIVAKGKWALNPSNDPREARFYTPKRDTRSGAMGTLADSFAILERELGRKIIDETDQPRPREVYWTPRSYSDWAVDDSWLNPALLSLEKQSSLKFIQTRRVIPVWIVSEKGQRQ